MHSFFAFALKVCKKCYYDPTKFFVKKINLGIKKLRIICWFQICWCRTVTRPSAAILTRWAVSSVRGGENISPVRPGFVHPQIPSFSVDLEYSGDFLCGEKKERAQRGIEPTVLTSIYKGIIIACSTCRLIAIVRNFSFRRQLHLDLCHLL